MLYARLFLVAHDGLLARAMKDSCVVKTRFEESRFEEFRIRAIWEIARERVLFYVLRRFVTDFADFGVETVVVCFFFEENPVFYFTLCYVESVMLLRRFSSLLLNDGRSVRTVRLPGQCAAPRLPTESSRVDSVRSML